MQYVFVSIFENCVYILSIEQKTTKITELEIITYCLPVVQIFGQMQNVVHPRRARKSYLWSVIWLARKCCKLFMTGQLQKQQTIFETVEFCTRSCEDHCQVWPRISKVSMLVKYTLRRSSMQRPTIESVKRRLFDDDNSTNQPAKRTRFEDIET